MSPDPNNQDLADSGLSASEHAQTAEHDALKEEVRRRSTLLEKKENAYLAQSRLLEAAEQKIRELVRSEGEADYKSRTLAAKLASTEKNLEQTSQQRKTLERLLSKAQQDTEKLRFELQAATQKLSSLEETHQNRDQSTDKLEHKNRELETKLSRVASKAELFKGKIESLQRQLADKDTEALLNRQKLELTVKEQERLRKELDETRASAKNQRANRSELEETVFQKERRLSEAEESLERQKEVAERLRTEREQARSEIARLEAELELAGRTKVEQEQQAEELLEQIQAIEQYHAEEMEALQRELQARDQERLDLEEALSQESKLESDVIANLRKERESLRAELQLKKRQVTELSSWAERVRPAYETLKKKFAQLQGEFRQLHSSHAESQAQKRQYKTQIEDLQQLEEQRAQERLRLQQEAEALRETLELSQSDMGTQTEELLELRRQVQDLNGQLESLRLALQASDSSKLSTEEELEEVTQLLEEGSQERLELDQNLAQTKRHLAEAKHELELLTVQFQDSQKKASRLSHELAQEQVQVSKAQGNIKELLRQRSQLLEAKKLLEESLGDFQSKEEQLRQSLRDSEAERAQLSQTFDDLQLEFESVNQNWITRIKELQSEVDSTTLKLGEVEAQKGELEIRSTQERESLQESLERVQAELLETSEARSFLQGQVDEFAENLSSAQARITELEADREDLLGVKEQLENDLASQSDTNRDTSTRLAETELQLEQVQTELERRKEELRRYAESRQQLAENLEKAVKQNRALRDATARSQKEALALRDYIEKLQAASKERLEKAKAALLKRDEQLKKQMQAYAEAKDESARLSRRLERSQQAESAYRGALLDLRLQLMTKAEMVEELEWHLGLVYQTLEDGQRELDLKETDVTALNDELQASRDEVKSTLAQLESLSQERAQLEEKVADLEAKLAQKQDSMDLQAVEFEHAQFKLNKTTVRLERVLADLSEEQERSARLGVQLTEALEDRNRRVRRLRELQREFSEWRDSKGEDTGREEREVEELTQDLMEAQSKEVELQKALCELREALAVQVREREEREQRLQALETDHSQTGDTLAGHPQDTSLSAGELAQEVVTGVELGAQVLGAQMDLLALDSRHDSLSEMMAGIESKESLAALLVDLQNVEQEREHRKELLEALESEWQQFREQIAEPSKKLLHTMIGIVEAEMKQSRAAEARVEVLREQLEAASPMQSAEESERLRRLLQEKTDLTEELEEELVQVSAQLTEANDQLAHLENNDPDSPHYLSWKETSALRQELKEKSELLEKYRDERQRGAATSDGSLEEELENLNTRYQKGRRRIAQLLAELEEKNRVLAELSKSPQERGEAVAPLLTDDEFELPLPPVQELADLSLDDDLDLMESLDELPPSFDLKEDTVEDLPAVPYMPHLILDEEESTSSDDRSDSQSATPDS